MGGDLHLAPYLLWYGWLTFLVLPHGSVGRVERSEGVVNGCVGHLTYLPTDLILVKVAGLTFLDLPQVFLSKNEKII